MAITYAVSYFLVPDLGDGTLWWKLSTVITCARWRRSSPAGQSLHLDRIRPRQEVVTASRGGASLNILSGLVAGGPALLARSQHRRADGHGKHISLFGLATLMLCWIFAFGLVVRLPGHGAGDDRRLLRPGDRQRAVFQASFDRDDSRHQEQLKKNFGFDVHFERAKDLLENDSAGNTFKATAKPVRLAPR